MLYSTSKNYLFAFLYSFKHQIQYFDILETKLCLQLCDYKIILFSQFQYICLSEMCLILVNLKSVLKTSIPAIRNINYIYI